MSKKGRIDAIQSDQLSYLFGEVVWNKNENIYFHIKQEYRSFKQLPNNRPIIFIFEKFFLFASVGLQFC